MGNDLQLTCTPKLLPLKNLLTTYLPLVTSNQEVRSGVTMEMGASTSSECLTD